MLDIDYGDLIDYLGEDPTTKEHHHLHGERGGCQEVHERRQGFADRNPS